MCAKGAVLHNLKTTSLTGLEELDIILVQLYLVLLYLSDPQLMLDRTFSKLILEIHMVLKSLICDWISIFNQTSAPRNNTHHQQVIGLHSGSIVYIFSTEELRPGKKQNRTVYFKKRRKWRQL